VRRKDQPTVSERKADGLDSDNKLLGTTRHEIATEPRIRCARCDGPMFVLAFLAPPVTIFDTS